MADSALARALDLLVKRDFFREELRLRLEETHMPDEVSEALDRLGDWGFLSDRRIGAALRESLERKRYGPEKVRWELLRRGVPEDIVEWVLQQQTEFDELGQARELAEKKFTKSDSPARVARYLMGRGFSEEVVREVVENDFASQGDTE